MRKRDLKLELYGIDKDRQAEILAFCKKYPEWKLKIKFLNDTVKASRLDHIGGMSGDIGDPTGSLAATRDELVVNCRLIEDMAAEASGQLKDYIILGACYGKSYNTLRGTYGMFCEKDAYYDARRYFLYLLDKRI